MQLQGFRKNQKVIFYTILHDLVQFFQKKYTKAIHEKHWLAHPQTDKAFERYCRVQDQTALEMAKFRYETVSGDGAVINLKRVLRRR